LFIKLNKAEWFSVQHYQESLRIYLFQAESWKVYVVLSCALLNDEHGGSEVSDVVQTVMPSTTI